MRSSFTHKNPMTSSLDYTSTTVFIQGTASAPTVPFLTSVDFTAVAEGPDRDKREGSMQKHSMWGAQYSMASSHVSPSFDSDPKPCNSPPLIPTLAPFSSCHSSRSDPPHPTARSPGELLSPQKAWAWVVGLEDLLVAHMETPSQ